MIALISRDQSIGNSPRRKTDGVKWREIGIGIEGISGFAVQDSDLIFAVLNPTLKNT